MSKLEIVAAALFLPDGKLVMQRRKPGADLLPGHLGFWGGKVESDESTEAALHRELIEESSLDPAKLELQQVGTFPLAPPLTARDSFDFILFRGKVSDANFDVKEGASAEAHAIADLRKRTDTLPTVRFVLNNVVEFSDGIRTDGS